MRFFCNSGLLLLAASYLVAADAPDSATLVNADGKEIAVTNLKLTTGSRRLSWLADPQGESEDARKGPLAVEFRESDSTTFVKGVITLVPVAHVESLTYDYKDQTARLKVKGMKEPLNGSLRFKGMNAFGFSGSVEGKSTTFSAGVPGKSGVKSVSFANAQLIPPAKATGTTWAVQLVQPKEKPPTMTVRNLKALYQFPAGVEKAEDGIPVRKGAMLSLSGAFKRFEMLATDPNTNIATAEIDTKEGAEKIIAIPLAMDAERKTGQLVGFVGEVEAGWKLFPLHTIKVMTLTGIKRKVE